MPRRHHFFSSNHYTPKADNLTTNSREETPSNNDNRKDRKKKWRNCQIDNGQEVSSTDDIIDDDFADRLVNVWKKTFGDAMILPVIGYPSNSGGIVTITHSINSIMSNNYLSINGVYTKSMLANNGFYSGEISNGHYLNLYKIIIPDIPGNHGELSTGQIYINSLKQNGLDISSVGCQWLGASLSKHDRGIITVHHQKIGLDPIEFTRKTISSLETVINVMTQK
jgi:hypothetical protein